MRTWSWRQVTSRALPLWKNCKRGARRSHVYIYYHTYVYIVAYFLGRAVGGCEGRYNGRYTLQQFVAERETHPVDLLCDEMGYASGLSEGVATRSAVGQKPVRAFVGFSQYSAATRQILAACFKGLPPERTWIIRGISSAEKHQPTAVSFVHRCLSLGCLPRCRGGAGLEQRPRQQRPRILTSWCLRGFGFSTTTVSWPLTSRPLSHACVPIGWQCKCKTVLLYVQYTRSRNKLSVPLYATHTYLGPGVDCWVVYT